MELSTSWKNRMFANVEDKARRHHSVYPGKQRLTQGQSYALVREIRYVGKNQRRIKDTKKCSHRLQNSVYLWGSILGYSALPSPTPPSAPLLQLTRLQPRPQPLYTIYVLSLLYNGHHVLLPLALVSALLSLAITVFQEAVS